MNNKYSHFCDCCTVYKLLLELHVYLLVINTQPALHAVKHHRKSLNLSTNKP